MESWDVSNLKDARVWIKIAGQPSREVQGTVTAITKPYVSQDQEDAVSLSLFSVQLDNGQAIEVSGSSFSRITSKFYP
jgi:hypothetical protein